VEFHEQTRMGEGWKVSTFEGVSSRPVDGLPSTGQDLVQEGSRLT